MLFASLGPIEKKMETVCDFTAISRRLSFNLKLYFPFRANGILANNFFHGTPCFVQVRFIQP